MQETEMCVDGAIDGNGSPPPFVLLHSLAMTRAIWSPIVDDLAQDHTVVTLDLPGHGASCTFSATSIPWLAARVADHLDSTGLGRFVVAGLSLGGCVAQQLTISRPDLVAGLCLIDTTAWYGPDAPSKWEERARRARNDGFGSLAGFQLARWFGPDFLAANAELGEQLLEIFCANDTDSYVATCRAMGAFDARDRLRGIAVPTDVVVGEHDPATPPSHAELLASSIGGARLTVLEGASHLSPVERPNDVAAVLRALHNRVGDASV